MNTNIATTHIDVDIKNKGFIILDKLFKEIGPRVSNRNGGYTRIMKFGFRAGDKAPMAIFELVDRVIVEETKQEKVAKKA